MSKIFITLIFVFSLFFLGYLKLILLCFCLWPFKTYLDVNSNSQTLQTNRSSKKCCDQCKCNFELNSCIQSLVHSEYCEKIFAISITDHGNGKSFKPFKTYVLRCEFQFTNLTNKSFIQKMLWSMQMQFWT